MKGIVPAGGLGTRLLPLTKVTNKHLLPIYDRGMIYDPIRTLADAGVTEIMPASGGNNTGDFPWTDAGVIGWLHLHDQPVGQTRANNLEM